MGSSIHTLLAVLGGEVAMAKAETTNSVGRALPSRVLDKALG